MIQTFEKIYLELFPAEFKLPDIDANEDKRISIESLEKPTYEIYRRWHDDVGKPFAWHSRPRIQDRARIESLLTSKGVELLFFKVDSESVGYSLTELDEDRSAEISDFGFLPHFTSRGYGSIFFPLIVQRLLQIGVYRIWLTTRSTNDSRVPLFYKRYGFREYKREFTSEPTSKVF